MGSVWDFSEASGRDRDRFGGKGANLAEMTDLGLPVPPGFIIDTDACRDYLEHDALPEGLQEEVDDHLRRLEDELGRKLGDTDDPLLVSVRSGAPISMPGMMDTVLNLGLNHDNVAGLAHQAEDERFAWDAYRRLLEMFGEIVLGVPQKDLTTARRDALGDQAEEDTPDVDRLQAACEGLKATIADAGAAFPQDPREQLTAAIEAVFGSWNGQRARRYRKLEGIPDDLGTAVTVQAMVFGNLGADSGTGVAFSRNPSTGEPQPYGDWLANAQGEDVVAGVRATKDLDGFRDEHPDLHAELLETLKRLEDHYADLQDVEFTVERGRFWILQTRAGKRTARAAVRAAVDLAEEGRIDRREAVRRVDPEHIDRLLHPQFDPSADYEVLTTGLAASPGAATGQVCFTADDAEERAADGPVVLVRPETSPEDIHGLAASEGVLTSRGGLVSHAAIVARSMGKPAVCGADEVTVDLDAHVFTVGDTTVREGDTISLSGTTGEVVVGEVPVVRGEPDEVFHRLLSWADEVRRLEVRANADTGEDAAHARELGATGIGLCRTEHQFLGDRLPLVRRVLLAEDEDAEQDALAELEKVQRQDFEALLEAMDGFPVTVRLLDPPAHEFLPDLRELEVAEARGELDEEGHTLLEAVRNLDEVNPMMGVRGVRLAVLHPQLYRMQARALAAAARARRDAGGDPRLEIMLPLTVTAQELALVAGWVAEAVAEVADDLDYRIGTMIETPRAALAAAELAEHAEFFSLGTNDLTQLVFGFSRDDVAGRLIGPYLDNGLLADDPFHTLDERVGELVRRVVEDGRATRPDIEIGICGEHGADPASVRICHDAGLDYVSCSPFRVPVARLAAAQAAMRGEEADG